MVTEVINEIIHMQLAVYQAGVDAGMWASVNFDEVAGLTGYLFPKSGNLATYNLIVEAMRREHRIKDAGAYTLFKMPAQIEKEIHSFLSGITDLKEYLTDPDKYLKSMDTIATDPGLGFVNIGKFNLQDADTILRLCASNYRYSFSHKIRSFPYFD